MKKKVQVITLISALILSGISFSPADAVTNEDTTSSSSKLVETTTDTQQTSETSTDITTDTQTDETSTNTSTTSDSTKNESTEATESTESTESTNTTTDTSADSNQPKADDSDEQAILDAIGKGDNFNSRLYLNYFGGKLDTLFATTSGSGFDIGFLMLYSGQLGLAKTQFEVDSLVIKQLMSTYLLYDIAFAKDSHFMSLLANNDGTSPSEYTGFYPNTLPLEGTALNNQTGKPMNLKAYYVNQNSDKTVIIHGGFRGNWDNGVVTPEYDNFYQAGYNLLFVDSRTTGGSDGDFVTYGQYESDDVLYWINREVQTKPNQGILLYGGSMGAATMMSVLAKPAPKNVKGIIENCGFQSIDEQLRYTYTNLVAPALENIPGVDLDIVADQAHEDLYMQLLKENYFDQELHLNTTENLPILGMSQTDIPKLLIHGTEDNVVPVSNAQSLYDVSKGYKDLVLVDGAGHGEAQKVDPATYNQHVSDFLAVVFNDQVKVRYVDEQNESLLSDKELILSGFYGESYQTEAKTFDHYELVSVEGLEQGTFDETIPVVTYKYKKVSSSTSDSSTNTDTSETMTDSSSSQPIATSDPKDPKDARSEAKKDSSASSTEARPKSYPKTGEKKSIVPPIFGGLVVVIVGAINFWRKRRS
ncbi:alpha/beta fold hydrolase [Candidatus Enterococcus courvalinii]|uniref:MucBP domain-containing protein n=1 Tax=Candidatus Enterococcus courvalinii TaxID=2815329 RepID=A0ABS3HYD5_9ENTE|nr:alpha/beta fold hydrolase [Enterococcus sp. MSG2901]MBO0481080.1 MucBP domain-containing protein [Enterococcus sp. MSG2901]